jgi:hypothetical protein
MEATFTVAFLIYPLSSSNLIIQRHPVIISNDIKLHFIHPPQGGKGLEGILGIGYIEAIYPQ